MIPAEKTSKKRMLNLFQSCCLRFFPFLFLFYFAKVLIGKVFFSWAFTFLQNALNIQDFLHWLLSYMDRLPLSMGGGGTGSSKRPLFDLNLSPPPEEEASSLEEERRRLVDSKEYKEADRHNLKLAERIKEIRQRAKEIAQERGRSPDDVDSAADYVAKRGRRAAPKQATRLSVQVEAKPRKP